MTLLEDDVRAALHRRAGTHEVVVPPVEDLVRAPYADEPARPSRRRALAGVAAALLAVAVGVTAVVVQRDEPGERPAPLATVPGPTAGTHGAVLTGFGPPVDGSELLFDWPVAAPEGTLVVLRERDGEGTAVVAFAPDTGTSSFDVLPLEGGTAVEVGGRPAVRYPPTHVQPGLPVLEVALADGERLFVAGVGLADDALVPLAEAAVGAADPGRGWWPDDRYEATYVGPDANPFAGQRGDERTLGYAVDGQAATVTFDVGSATDPTDYAWFLPGASVEETGGRRTLRWVGGRGATAAWTQGGGMVVVHAAAGRLDEVIASVRVVDRASWDAERAAATDPGSRFGSDTTEAMPGPTG